MNNILRVSIPTRGKLLQLLEMGYVMMVIQFYLLYIRSVVSYLGIARIWFNYDIEFMFLHR